MRPDRIGLGVTIAMHALALAFLLSYEPARKALLAAAPIMVEIILPPKVEQPKPQPPTELPKPKPIAKQVERPFESPLITAPVEAPSPVVAPPPPPVVVAAPPAPPAPITPPIFHADYLDNPSPIYPALSKRIGEQGRGILRVFVGIAGRAEDVQVFKTSGSPRLDEAARDAVRQWKFTPGKRGTEPIATWVQIPFSFQLKD
ncbi:MAG TPA: energy transducer TonB [Burkholderiales bacterium]|nr:energy transducer TonB [Burkholderiales bacterium]